MQQIVKQPNGRYAIFSSVVDDFVLADATPQDIIKFRLREAKEEIQMKTLFVIEKLENNEMVYPKPFGLSFDEAINRIRNIHGDKAKSLIYFGK